MRQGTADQQGGNNMHTVLVLGGYGNFGSYICRELCKHSNIRLLIAGRNPDRAERFAEELGLPKSHAIQLDANAADLAHQLRLMHLNTLIHTAGPFQGQDYHVARACIDAGCHYIDLADGREFVAGISQLDDAAREAGVLVTSGASSVPALSSAVADHFLPEFAQLKSIRHAIASGAKTPGIATMRAVLGYCGKPFQRLENGRWLTVYGWQDLHRRRYPDPIGRRWLGSCDVPDLELFPERYPQVESVSFHAGLGVPVSHLATWVLSWLVRWKLIPDLARWARPLQWLSRQIERVGTPNSAMHVELAGTGHDSRPIKRIWHVLAFRNHGPNIPCGAAIALTRKLARGDMVAGARPCVGLVSLDEYMEALAGLDIRQVSGSSDG